MRRAGRRLRRAASERGGWGREGLGEILEVRGEGHVVRLHTRRGIPASALIVVDQPKPVVQPVEVREEVAVVEVWPRREGR